MIGFLDSDKHKINKRLSGTPYQIYDKAHIKNKENIKVLIIAEKYKEEIKMDLLKYNKDVIII